MAALLFNRLQAGCDNSTVTDKFQFLTDSFLYFYHHFVFGVISFYAIFITKRYSFFIF